MRDTFHQQLTQFINNPSEQPIAKCAIVNLVMSVYDNIEWADTHTRQHLSVLIQNLQRHATSKV